MKKNTAIIGLLVACTPVVSYATLDGLQTLLSTILTIIKSYVIPIIFALAIVYFFWGMAQFILKDAGNDKTRQDGKNKMIWGIIALFVMASIIGILQLIGSAVGITPNISNSAPTLNTGGLGDCTGGTNADGTSC